MKYLRLFALVGFLAACTTTATAPEDTVPVPSGYYQLCVDYPDSIFCEQPEQ